MAVNRIESYVKAAKTASDRGRFVVLVLVTGSIISFAAFWNSREDGWVSQRLHLAKIAFHFCESSQAASSDSSIKSTGNSHDVDSSTYEPNFSNESRFKRLSVDDQKLVPRASMFYQLRHFHSCKNLSDEVQGLARINAEDVDLIHVPFFGFTFDINDLGMLSGITFVVVLVWLRLTLESELRSVRITFAQAEKLSMENKTAGTESSELGIAYRLLGMYQVFTRVPIPASLSPEPVQNRPIRFKRLVWWFSFLLAWAILLIFISLDIYRFFNPFEISWGDLRIVVDTVIVTITMHFLREAKPEAPIHFWQHLSLGLYWLPVIVLLAIFRNDLATLQLGLSVSVSATLWLLSMEVLLLIAAWLLTLDCMRIAHETDDEWNHAAQIIQAAATKTTSPAHVIPVAASAATNKP